MGGPRGSAQCFAEIYAAIGEGVDLLDALKRIEE